MKRLRAGVGAIPFLIFCLSVLLVTIWWVLMPGGSVTCHLMATGLSKGRMYPYVARFAPYKGRRMGGSAHVVSTIEQFIASHPSDVMSVLSVGSEISGTADAYFTRGSAVINVLNLYHLDAMLVGNIEFSFGRQRLEELAMAAKFPFLSSNILVEGAGTPPDFLVPDRLVDTGKGVTLGILGVTPPATPILTSKENVVGLQFQPLGTEFAARVKALREKGAQVVVVLSLIDKARLTAEEWAALVKAAPDVLFMVDFEVDPPPAYKTDGIIVKTVSGYNLGKELDLLSLNVSLRPFRITGFTGARLPVFTDEVEPAPPVEQVLRWEEQTSEQVKSRKLAEIATDAVRQYELECPVGNLLTDAMRAFFRSDLALQNSGGIQADISQGEFTMGKLFDVLPFDNQVVVMNLTGQDVLEVLTTSASLERGLLQISGGSYVFSNRGAEGYELKEVQVNGKPLDPNQTYRVTINSFLADGGDNFRTFKRGKGAQFGPLQRETVRAYLEGLASGTPLTLNVEGRIRRE